MTEAKHDAINLLRFRGDSSTSFTGRPEGKLAREALELDYKDDDDVIYTVRIPIGTTAFNPSFFLGFFFESISSLGIDKFSAKYVIEFDDAEDEDRIESINRDIAEGKRHAINQIQTQNTKRGGLLSFFKNRL